jgi:hypothetical protein
MCIVSSQAYASHQLCKVLHFQSNELSKPQICEISKGVSKPIPKFPPKAIIRTQKFGTLLLAFLFFIMAFWEKNPVDLASCRKSRRLCSMDPFPSSQAETLDVEILLSSQGSQIVNVEKSSIVYSFLVRAHNLQILRIEQGSTPRIDRSLWLHFSLMLSQT